MPTTAHEARQQLAGCTIWLWHYLHADWQWEQSRAWHEDRYAEAVHEALDLMQRDPDFMYYFDSEAEFFAPVARRLGPRLAELEERVREGRVRIVSAQVSNCRPTQVGDETYLRNLQLGRAFFQANLPPTDLSLFHSVDVAIGGSQMPQILRQAGFQFYRAMRPHGALDALGLPQQFHWQGLDGSRILVVRGTYQGLGQGALEGYEADWDGVVARLFDRYLRNQLAAGRSPSRQLYLVQGDDDTRPLREGHCDRPVPLLDFLAEWRRRETVPIRWCTPLEYARAVAEHADELPVVCGVLDGADCSYNAANQGSGGLWAWRQMNDRRLLRAERWAAAAAGAVDYAYPEGELRALWRQHLTYQAHAQEFAFREDFAHLVGLARAVQFHAQEIEEAAQRALVQAAGGGERTARYILNPHPWPVEADVEVYHPCALAGVESLTAVDEAGRPLPQQRLSEFRHPRFAGALNDQRRLVRLSLPALGYRRIALLEKGEPPSPPPPAPADGLLEACGLRLLYRGQALRELHDLQSGAIYRSRDGAPYPDLSFHVLDNQDWLFAGPELRREPFQPARGEWLQTGPLRWQHRTYGRVGPYEAQIDTLLGERARELQVRVRLEGHWQEPPLSGFVSLGSDIGAGGRITVDVPFGVEPRDPDRDIYAPSVTQDPAGPYDLFERQRPGFFWGRSWADWSGEGRGLTWLSADGCYYWLKEPERLGHIVVRAVQLRPGTWQAFVSEGLTGCGVHTFSYALRCHDGDWRAGAPQRRSAELQHPPVAIRPDCPTAATLAATSLLELGGPALLSAYYRQGSATLLRLYESEGRGGQVTIRLHQPPASAQAVDLLDRPLDLPLRVEGHTVIAQLRPWQVVTLRLG